MKLRSWGLALASTLVVTGMAACGDDSDSGKGSERPVSIEPASNAATDAALAWLDEQQLGLGSQADLHLALETLDDDARQQVIVDNFVQGADAYINTSYEYEGDQFSGVSSGAIAKTLYVATAADLDPTAFGGEGAEELDLLALLSERMVTEGPSQGRLADLALKNGEDDPQSNYANTFGQAYAVRGLAEAEGEVADGLYAPARDFLLSQQCDAGFFRLYFNPDAEADDQSCDAGEAAAEAPAGDTTALVLLLLDEVADDDATVAAALDRAEEWLAEQQEDDGTFPSEPAGAEANTNSVGIAGWALGERGNDEAAAAAAMWTRQHQIVGFPCDAEAVEHEGAVAFTEQSRRDAVENGIDDAVLMEWQSATVQAVALLAWATPAADDLQVSVTESDVEVTGAAPGEPVCAHAGEVHASGVADDAGTATIELPSAPDGVVTVETLAGSQESDAS